MLGQFSTVMYNHMIYYPYAQPVYPQPVPSYSHIQYYSPPYSLPPPYPVMQQPQYCEQLVHQPVHISQPCYVSSLTAAPITTYSQHQYWAGHAMPYQPYSYPCMPASMITYVHPQWETGFQQAPINYPFEHSPQVTSNREPTSAPFSFDNPTAPFDNPFQIQQQPQRQITEPQKPAADYGFYMKSGKILFAMSDKYKAPLFSEYFEGLCSSAEYSQLDAYKERRYTSALVFEQKLKEIGRLYGSFLEDEKLDDFLDRLKKTTEGNKIFKDSTDTIKNKINNIFEINKHKPLFEERIKLTLNEGIALKNKSHRPQYQDADKLRNALLYRDLTKEDAGQIAKAISIIERGTKPTDKDMVTKIDSLYSYYITAPQKSPSVSPINPKKTSQVLSNTL